MTLVSKTDITDAETVHFLEDLKSQLTKFTNLELVAVVRMVFSKVRNSLSINDRERLSANVPGLFQFVFLSHELKDDSNKICMHLDEIVMKLVEEDHQRGRGLFKSEIDTLEIVIVVLNRLAVFFQKFGINPYPYTLIYELQQAMQGQSI